MNNSDCWALVESNDQWLRTLLAKTRIPAGVSRDDILQELRLELYQAFSRSYDPAKAKPTTFVACVFYRRVPRIIRRQQSNGCKLSDDVATPVQDDSLSQLQALLASGRLNQVEQYAVNYFLRRGRLDYGTIRARFPGEFALDNAREVKRKRQNYISELWAAIKDKL